jgi:hypothetical protein
MLLLVACSAPKETEMFPLAAECVECHDDISIDGDTQYSFVADWLNSTHALSATDPFFMAISRSETQELPAASEIVQETCAGCHLPMADLQAQATGTSRAFLDYAATPSHELHAVYADGISCMLCHQLADNPTADSTMFLNSGLHIDFTEGTPRNIYGFYTLDAANQQPMEESIGYYSRQSNAERRLPMCDVCHTLYTPSFDVEGNATGSYLPEQMTTREWLNSTLVNQSCQSCHMPLLADAGPLSNMELESAIEGRIAAHNFVGANAYLLRLSDNGEGTLDDGATAITDFLQNETAELAVNAGREGESLSLDVNISSITGHKFPTGFPARRAWLYVTVRDSAGTLLYESGGYNAEGMILDDDGDLVAGTFEPHYQVIDEPGQVQIYESVMLNSEGKVTTNLLQGVLYGKDNRLLPPGFDKTAVVPDIAVVGEAFEDEDFTGGSDDVRYLITLPSGTTGQVTVEVQLLYQAMGYRYAQNLREHPSEEQELLFDLMAQVPNEPVLVTGKQVVL